MVSGFLPTLLVGVAGAFLGETIRILGACRDGRGPRKLNEYLVSAGYGVLGGAVVLYGWEIQRPAIELATIGAAFPWLFSAGVRAIAPPSLEREVADPPAALAMLDELVSKYLQVERNLELEGSRMQQAHRQLEEERIRRRQAELALLRLQNETGERRGAKSQGKSASRDKQPRQPRAVDAPGDRRHRQPGNGGEEEDPHGGQQQHPGADEQQHPEHRPTAEPGSPIADRQRLLEALSAEAQAQGEALYRVPATVQRRTLDYAAGRF